MQSCFETRPSWWFMYDTTDLLSECTSTWCTCMSGRKNWQVWHTARFSRLLMCRPISSSDKRTKVGLPSHSAPQPLLEASVMTTFLLCAVSKITPCFSQRRSLQRSRADTQAQVTVTRWRPRWRPLLQPELDGSHVKQTQLKYRRNRCHKGWPARPRPAWQEVKTALKTGCIREGCLW